MEETTHPQENTPTSDNISTSADNNTQTPSQAGSEPKPAGADTTALEKNKSSKGIKIALAVLVLVSSAIAIYMTYAEQHKQIFVPQKPIKTEEPIKDSYPIDDDVATWKEYTNQKYEFYLQHPSNATLTQYDIGDEEPAMYKVYFTPNTSEIKNLESVEESDIKEGLLFKITIVKNVELKTPQTSAEEKVRFFKNTCPSSAKITDPQKGNFSGFDSFSFSVADCRGNYKITYVKRKTNIYEISQFSQGDIGYEPKYSATNERIKNALKLTNTIAPVPLERWIDFKANSITFKHPQMDDKCCNISGPVPIEGFKGLEQVIVLAIPNSNSSGNSSFNGFGVFRIHGIPKESIPTLIEQQKNALIEEYKIIVGKTPNVESTEIEVGGVKGTYVKGLAWWGDMVFVPVDESNGRTTLYMIGKTEILKGEFDSLFNEILGTFQFPTGVNKSTL